MARYQVVRWQDIPSLVEAWDTEGTVRQPLSQRFQELIDAVAMRRGVSDSDAYLDAWHRGPEAERPGGAQPVAETVAAELEATFGDLVDRYLGER